MKLYIKVLSTFLAVITVLGTMAGLFTIEVSAAKETIEAKLERIYTKTVFNTPQEKLASMTKLVEENGYQIWADQTSGEVATVQTDTGDILFSNPYDVASAGGVASIQKQVLSQIVVQYTDNGTTKYLYSFEEATMRQQVHVLAIKHGVRVEYTIGQETTRKLVPRWVPVDSFEKYIIDALNSAVDREEMSDYDRRALLSYYEMNSLSNRSSERAKQQLLMMYPCCAEMDIYVFGTDNTSADVNRVEAYIKAYCEDYTFEQMDADHERTGYVADEEKFPVFKMALEYTIDSEDAGLVVRIPCNGLRYDMSAYTLEAISVLPYMGAGNNNNEGFNFYPDGSGALFDFAELNKAQTTTVKGKIYGTDYAYHTIGGTYEKTIHVPVYGTVASETIYTYSYKTKSGESVGPIKVSSTVMSKADIVKTLSDEESTLTTDIEEEHYKRGYVAIIEEGDSLTELQTYHAGALSKYSTMMNFFNPKPKDSYDISDSISVTGSATWTVVSDRKYTGNIQIRYKFLTDEKVIEDNGLEATHYTTDWLGMAEYYRDYLITNGVLKPVEAEQLENDLPLYIEVFGALETQKTVLTVPVNVMTPLTTFDNMLTMYDELHAEGVNNVNFKMTGFANGGMYYTVPAALKWEKAVGGNKGFSGLIDDVKEINEKEDNHIGLFPDFDFSYVHVDKLFDSTNLKKDAVKTVDDRYTSIRSYSATRQEYVSFYQLAIAPSRYSKFYNKLLKKYGKYDIQTMSVGTLGNALNSDFDEDDPYNREDSKEFTQQAFADLQNAGYSLMTDAANAYAWKYVDHIVNVDLDSSRYIRSSASIPFLGAVLHGSVQFAGTPLNEESDTDYALLRAIENGASLYFILSYQNTNELKEDSYLSQYYSVQYEIWKDDVALYYNKLNTLLRDVQDKVIIGHEFLDGDRVLDEDELKQAIKEQLEAAIIEEAERQQNAENDSLIAITEAWRNSAYAAENISTMLNQMIELNDQIESSYASLAEIETNIATSTENLLTALTLTTYDMENAQVQEYAATLNAQMDQLKSTTSIVLKRYNELKALYQEIQKVYTALAGAKDLINNSTMADDVKANMIAKIETVYEVEAEVYRTDVETELTESFDKGYVDPENSAYAIDRALAILSGIDSSVTELKDCLILMCGAHVFTEEDIMEAVEGSEELIINMDETAAESKYHQIVAVTYGDRDGETHQKTAYKTFILNYNNYSVRVVYDGIEYTIPSGDYVVIQY